MFSGTVIHGKGYGKQLGYPTANLSTAVEDTGLSSGVYAAYTTIDGTKYTSALMINTAVPYVETHVIGFHGDLYGTVITVHPVQKISDLVACKNEEELKEKIAADMQLIREFFS